MSRKQERAFRLIGIPLSAATGAALLAPAFGNPPALEFLLGLLGGLIVGAIWCAIAEA